MTIIDFLNKDIGELLNNNYVYITLTFEDKTLNLTYTESLLDHYILNVLHKHNKNIKITSDFSVINYYNNGNYNANVITKSFSNITKHIIENIENELTINYNILDQFFKDVYYTYDHIYNNIVFKNLKYVVSINILDFLEIQHHPKLIEAINKVKNNYTINSINNVYEILDNIIYNEKQYEHNILAELYRAGIMNGGQFKQVLGSRGFVTELNSKIYKIPIANSFTLGMNNLYDIATESRTAAKALIQSTKAISDAEVFTRKLQLACMTIEKVIYTDCGNTKTIDWLVRPEERTNTGMLTHKCDLPNLVGKMYLEDGVWKIIKETDKHLIGKTIKLRSVKDCKLSNPHHICVKCLGTVGFSIPEHANLGHYCSTELASPTAQLILSTKHHSGSADTDTIILDVNAKEVLVVTKNGYTLKDGLIDKNNKVTLIVTQEEAFGIFDIKNELLNSINPESVSRLTNIIIEVENKNGKIKQYPIEVQNGNRYGVFTTKFLEYIINNNYNVDNKNRIHIDISKWKFKQPFIYLPSIEFSFVAFAAEIEKIATGNGVNKNNNNYEKVVNQLFNLANTKIDVSLSIIEVIMYAFTTYDKDNGNYKLGRNSPNMQLATLNEIIDNRTMGNAFGYDYLKRKLLNPNNFFKKNKQDHLLDVIICPKETMEYKGKKL